MNSYSLSSIHHEFSHIEGLIKYFLYSLFHLFILIIIIISCYFSYFEYSFHFQSLYQDYSTFHLSPSSQATTISCITSVFIHKTNNFNHVILTSLTGPYRTFRIWNSESCKHHVSDFSPLKLLILLHEVLNARWSKPRLLEQKEEKARRCGVWMNTMLDMPSKRLKSWRSLLYGTA